MIVISSVQQLALNLKKEELLGENYDRTTNQQTDNGDFGA